MTESAKAAPRRRHAQANRRRILDVARETLSADPETTVDDIARAAGIARRTLYGHFAGREDLVNALAVEAVESLRQAFVEERNPAEPADLALARYVLAVWGIGDRFRMLIALGRRDPDGDIRGALTAVRDLAGELLAQGQRDGVFADHLPAPVLAHVMESVVVSMLESVNDETWEGSAPAAATAVLLAVGRTRPEAEAVLRHLRTGGSRP
ncbi:TetR/AcrR family transcriptional regulator [Streptomyces sp. NBC_01352]|uniref:TetR/AcrR family transcriptional regulator n=1 Tax=Streptomyces sp. NBC_01352 TaxID=2903834 RepID=UPI002E33BA0C|nr:TetR/AcrR family transcriptional regulator [Streptomyces sp. NBC_01352]